MFHAAEDLEEPEKHPVTLISGVADRIAALEMLLYLMRKMETELRLSAGTNPLLAR